MKNKNQLIGCCGLDCEKCDAGIATITDDNALREQTATLWSKLNGVTITPEMINCVGCRIEGVKHRSATNSVPYIIVFGKMDWIPVLTVRRWTDARRLESSQQTARLFWTT